MSSPENNFDALVVGAGAGGLFAAARLQHLATALCWWSVWIRLVAAPPHTTLTASRSTTVP